MKSFTKFTDYRLLCALPAILFGVAAQPSALASSILKFSQLPMLDTPLVDDLGFVKHYHGHDELSTAVGQTAGGADDFRGFLYRGPMMADDFADESSSPVFHVRWWGSYLNGPFEGVDKFLIAFSQDVPADPMVNPFSHPGDMISSQVVTRGPLARGSGTFTEQLAYPLSVDGPIYEYDAELHLGQEFHQQPDTVYWLTIAALVENPNIQWGWHNRDYTLQNALASTAPGVTPGEHLIPVPQQPEDVWHFQDDAVSGLISVELRDGAIRRVQPGPGGYLSEFYQSPSDGPFRLLGDRRGRDLVSLDLAFELYTVPEPASICLCCFGFALVVGSRSRRKP